MRNKFPKPIAFALVLGVFLPSACILWFMVEAMQNERLAVRQKVIDIYHNHLLDISQLWNEYWMEKAKIIDSLERQNPDSIIFAEAVSKKIASSVIVHPIENSMGYPTAGLESQDIREKHSKLWSKAQSLEFEQEKPAEAIPYFREITQGVGSSTMKARAYQGWARCLIKIQEYEQALKILTQDLSDSRFQNSKGEQSRLIYPNALLLALDNIKRVPNSVITEASIKKTLIQIVNDYSNILFPAKQRLFIMNRLANQGEHFSTHMAEKIAADYLASVPARYNSDNLQATKIPGLWKHYISKNKITALYAEAYLQSEIQKIMPAKTGVMVKLIPPMDSNNGQDAETVQPLDSLLVGEYMPGWRLNLYLSDSMAVDEVADAKIAVYLWIGILLIASVTLISIVVIRYIVAQQRTQKLKNDLLSTVTHELKTPLSSVRLLVETLLHDDTKLETRTAEYLRLIDKENRRLTRLIDNFLTYSRMEKGKQFFHFEQVAPAAIIDTALNPFHEKFKSDGFTIEVDIQQGIPTISTDHDAMVVVINNLLENAYKYSNDKKQITVKAYLSETSVYFEVTDKGTGLSRVDCKKVFERFYRAEQSLHQGIDGCGLGLSIVKYIVDMHHGEVLINSELGKGSTFTVAIPREQV